MRYALNLSRCWNEFITVSSKMQRNKILQHLAPILKDTSKLYCWSIKKQIFCSMYEINLQLRLLWLKNKNSTYFAFIFQLIPYLCTHILKLFRVRKESNSKLCVKGKKKKNLLTNNNFVHVTAYIFMVCVKFIEVM